MSRTLTFDNCCLFSGKITEKNVVGFQNSYQICRIQNILVTLLNSTYIFPNRSTSLTIVSFIVFPKLLYSYLKFICLIALFKWFTFLLLQKNMLITTSMSLYYLYIFLFKLILFLSLHLVYVRIVRLSIYFPNSECWWEDVNAVFWLSLYSCHLL